jgi:prepilin-type N-terminal cleavage/methylation domain-containing protein
MNKKGFTLIELLVVIAIIGLLVSIGAFAARQAQTSGRDARRKADLETIRSGLEIFRSDCQNYPSTLPSPGARLVGDGTPAAACPASQTYIEKVPGDPQEPSSKYYYDDLTSGTYVLCARLENAPNPAMDTTNCGSSQCGTGANCNYIVRNP